MRGVDETTQWFALRQSLDAEGYVVIRGAVPAAAVAEGRRALLTQVQRRGGLGVSNGVDPLGPDAPLICVPARIGRTPDGRGWLPGWTVDALSGRVVDFRDEDEAGWAQVGRSPPVQSLFDGDLLRNLTARLFGARAEPGTAVSRPSPRVQLLPQYTWLRMKGRGDVTIEHADYYFFHRSTQLFRDLYPTRQRATPVSLVRVLLVWESRSRSRREGGRRLVGTLVVKEWF